MKQGKSSEANGFAAQREQLTRNAVECCLSDLDMALSLLDFAGTTAYPATRERNRRHAQHALQTVLQQVAALHLKPAQRRLLDAKVQAVKMRLQALTIAGDGAVRERR